eukprot:3588151-Pleurochrysis_carterae.AAC.2
MSALASTFKSNFQLAQGLLACHRLVVLFKAFHLLTVEFGVTKHCLRKGLDDVDAFQLRVEECSERKEDADGCCLSSCRE